MEDGHARTVDEVVNFYGVDSDRGLSTDQVKRNQEKYGPNGKCPRIQSNQPSVALHLSCKIKKHQHKKSNHRVDYVIHMK